MEKNIEHEMENGALQGVHGVRNIARSYLSNLWPEFMTFMLAYARGDDLCGLK